MMAQKCEENGPNGKDDDKDKGDLDHLVNNSV